MPIAHASNRPGLGLRPNDSLASGIRLIERGLCELVLAALLLHLTASRVQQKMWRASAISRKRAVQNATALRLGAVWVSFNKGISVTLWQSK
jgi:hypothetical protein